MGEWFIELDADRVPAGAVHFEVANVSAEPHELVVVAGLAPDDLPLDADGALDESALPAGALIGKVEPFPAGETCDGHLRPGAGDYTLICNIVEEHEGELEAHPAEGMVATLTVTG